MLLHIKTTDDFLIEQFSPLAKWALLSLGDGTVKENTPEKVQPCNRIFFFKSQNMAKTKTFSFTNISENNTCLFF